MEERSSAEIACASALAELRADGVAVIPNVLTADEAADALSRLWRASDESKSRGIPSHIAGLDPDAHNVRVFNLVDLDLFFASLVENPISHQLVGEFLGPNYILSNLSANIARPGSRSMAIHSDLQFVVPEPWSVPQSVNVIWCLTDTYADNGATLYAPGSHRHETAGSVPETIASQMVPLEAKAGSVMIMDGRVWHTSGNNITSSEDRALVFGYYTAPYIRPQWNFSASLSEPVKQAVSPNLRFRLGLDESLNQILVQG